MSTMENNIAKAIETTATTKNEGNEYLNVAVEIVDTVGGGLVPIQQQKSTPRKRMLSRQ